MRRLKRLASLWGVLAVCAALWVGAAGHVVRAQDGPDDDPPGGDTTGDATSERAADDVATDEPAPDALTLRSVDADFPVWFQALEPDEAAQAAALRPQITLSAGDRSATPLVYVAVENTGWSEGTVGLFSDLLDSSAEYVALEVRDRGMPGYAVREDGQGVVVPLTYDADLGPDGEAGFRLHLVIGAIHSFRVFRVADDGLMVFAQQSSFEGGAHVRERTLVTVDPAPVFGDLVLETHIEARTPPESESPASVPPEPAASTPEPPSDSASETGASETVIATLVDDAGDDATPTQSAPTSTPVIVITD